GAGGAAVAGVRGAGRPDPARRRQATRGGRRHLDRPRVGVRRVGAGRVEAPQGARGRRSRPTHARRATTARHAQRRGPRPHDGVDRAAPTRGGGAVPAARRPARPDGPGRGAATPAAGRSSIM
ncbi:MAG: Transcriptional regulator, ArsR family, partial [uncultured Nocardioidaceae bacterium]